MIEDLKVLDTISVSEFQRELRKYENEWYRYTDVKIYTVYNSFDRKWDNITHYFTILTKYKENVNPENVKGELSWSDWTVQGEEWELQKAGKASQKTMSTTSTDTLIHEEMREVSVSDMFNSVFVKPSNWEDIQSTVEQWDNTSSWTSKNIRDSEATQMLINRDEDVSMKESDDSEALWTTVSENANSDTQSIVSERYEEDNKTSTMNWSMRDISKKERHSANNSDNA